MSKHSQIDNQFIARFADAPALFDQQAAERVTQLLNALKTDMRFAVLQQHSMNGYRMTDAENPLDDDENFWPAADSWMASLRPYRVKDGVLSIPVKGVLLSGFPYQFFDMATGYQYIAKAFERGMQDADVRGIALNIDSPGGEVQECFDCVDGMFAKRDQKPVRSFANDFSYSAAYAIGSVGVPFNVGRTGGVGSIGVVTAHIDMSKMLENFGVKLTFIHFGKHKVDGNPYEPLPAGVKARLQKRIDAIGAVFTGTVARNRTMEDKAVRDTEALTYAAEDAVAIGLADSIGPTDAALADFAASLKPKEDFSFMAQPSPEEKAAADKLAADNAAATAAANQKKIDDAKAEAEKAGAELMRTRIKAIMALEEAKKRPAAAQAVAMDTAMPVDEAKVFLAKLPEEKSNSAGMGNAFDKAMSSENPDLGAGGGDKEAADDRVADVLAAQAATHGFKRKAAA